MAVTNEKKKKGTFWSLEEVIGKKRRKKEKKKRSKGTCGGEKKKGKKKRKKNEIWYMCGGEKKREKKRKKKKKEMLSQYFHNIFTINFNIGEKKIIFLEREKNNFNSTFKLKSVSIFITNIFTILSQLILNSRLLLANICEKKIILQY